MNLRVRAGFRSVVSDVLAGAPAAILTLALCTPGWSAQPGSPEGATHADRPQRNVIIFIADGLRHDSVNSTDAPTLFAIRQRGVNFANSHSLFPTVTTPNASAIATGHYLGDTGDFANSEYIGLPIFNRGNFGKMPGTPVPFLESDQVLGDVDDLFANGNFLNEMALLALAREHGFGTAAIGKLGPVAIQDVPQVKPAGGRFAAPQTIILDDATGNAAGVPLSTDLQSALSAAGLGLVPTARNQPIGSVTSAGTLTANKDQQKWFADAATKAVLPMFVKSGRPFVLVYWSRDPDGTQHNQGDSLNALKPGINGPTSRAAVANADANLKQILDYIDADPALHATTDVFVTSDHGFATISKYDVDAQGHGTASYAASFTYLDSNGQPDVVRGWLPPGFLAIDIAHALSLPMFDPEGQVKIDGVMKYAQVDPAKPPSTTSRQHPSSGHALIGGTGAVQTQIDAKVIVAANGGADLIYVADHDRALARRIVDFLSRQDYVGALFVDSAFGEIPGALPLSAVALEGSAQMPRPAIVVSFRNFLLEPGSLLSAVQIADTPLQEGQGMHGNFGRDNTFNNMAAIGPDFKQGFIDRLPMGNADIAVTVAHVLGLELPSVGKLQGRVLAEALAGGPESLPFRHDTALSSAAASGKATALQYQEVDGRRYFDVACFVDARHGRDERAREQLCIDLIGTAK